MTGTIQLGDIRIDRIVEQEAPFFGALAFFPTLTPELLAENRGWMSPKFMDGDDNLILCIQSYLVRTKHHNILIDTCVGNHKPRPTRPFWDQMMSDRYERNLVATGLGVGDIDFVMCTHLHVDHVGWNTRLDNGRWVPTFPKARYIFSELELAHWTERNAKAPLDFPAITDSVLPIVAAGRSDVVKSDFAMNDHVRLVPSAGHTFDHFSVLVGKPGADALVTGDMIHSPLQARYPEMGMMADWDSKQGGETRRRLLGRFCDTSTLWCTAHFAQPSTGRIGRWGDGFKVIEG